MNTCTGCTTEISAGLARCLPALCEGAGQPPYGAGARTAPHPRCLRERALVRITAGQAGVGRGRGAPPLSPAEAMTVAVTHRPRAWRIGSGGCGTAGSTASLPRPLRQSRTPGVNTATRRCSVDASHRAPAPGCMCGMYVVPEVATALAYSRRTTLGRQPSTPVAMDAYPWPFGDPAGTVRVGAAAIVGSLYLYPGTDAMRRHVEPPVDGGLGHPELHRQVPPAAAGWSVRRRSP
jgi:hypothetical protein